MQHRLRKYRQNRVPASQLYLEWSDADQGRHTRQSSIKCDFHDTVWKERAFSKHCCISSTKMYRWLSVCFTLIVAATENLFFEVEATHSPTMQAQHPENEPYRQMWKTPLILGRSGQSFTPFFASLIFILAAVAVGFVVMQCYKSLKAQWRDRNGGDRGRRMSIDDNIRDSVS